LGGEKAVIISISPANADDAESLTAIQKQAFERLYKIYQDEGNPYLRGSNEIEYQVKNGIVDIYKIFADDSLCGGISIRNNGNGEYYLHRIYVLPKLQGKGIAQKTIKLCEKNYPDAKRWKVDFPIDQLANKKCYENNGYYDTGLRETTSDKLTLAFYEKAVCGIYEIHQNQINTVAEVIRASFITVASEFGLTEQNCPNHTSFITADKLQSHIESGWLMYGLFNDERLIGYVSLSNKNDGVYELHNLAVLPEYRHKGYGKLLLDFCKSKVKENNGVKITIGIIEEHTVLKKWYAINGFVHIGTRIFTHLPFTVGFMEWVE
jgi:GNAT superfamily N-acetyltransferase